MTRVFFGIMDDLRDAWINHNGWSCCWRLLVWWFAVVPLGIGSYLLFMYVAINTIDFLRGT